MKFTHSWLKSHLDTAATLDAIAETLTRVGLEVEGVEDKARALSAFTIAYVIEARPHPNADRLRVCMVDTGAPEPVQVVCGQEHHARQGRDPRRRVQRHAVLGRRARNLGRP